jgi:hypothetical protein
MKTLTYQQYALLDEDAAIHWTVDEFHAEWERAREKGWQAIVAEYEAMPYRQYLQTDHWRWLSERAKHRDGNRRVLCNAGDRTLNAHHRSYEPSRYELRSRTSRRSASGATTYTTNASRSLTLLSASLASTLRSSPSASSSRQAQ